MIEKRRRFFQEGNFQDNVVIWTLSLAVKENVVISFLFFLVHTNIRGNVVLSAPHTCEVSSVGPGLPTTQRPSLCQSADKTTPISPTNNANMFQNGIFLRADFCIRLPLWAHWNPRMCPKWSKPNQIGKNQHQKGIHRGYFACYFVFYLFFWIFIFYP